MRTRSAAQRIVSGLVIASLCACTSMQPVQLARGESAPTSATTALKEGDQVRIRLVAGDAEVLTLAEVRDDALVGRNAQGERHVGLAEIESIERRQFDLLRTALLVLGLVALVDAVRSYAIAVGRLTGP